MKLRGVIIPAAVPVAPGGEPGLAGYESLFEFQIASGIHGVFGNGPMGGFALWTGDWQRRLAENAATIVAGRLPPEFIANWTLKFCTTDGSGWSVLFQGDRGTLLRNGGGFKIYEEPWDKVENGEPIYSDLAPRQEIDHAGIS